MTITTHTEQLKTKGHNDCVEITEAAQQAVSRAKVRNGLATIFVTGSSHHLAGFAGGKPFQFMDGIEGWTP